MSGFSTTCTFAFFVNSYTFIYIEYTVLFAAQKKDDHTRTGRNCFINKK
jgi:hypothetical protein